MRKLEDSDFLGQRFGRLVVKRLHRRGTVGVRDTFWRCVCDCGNSTIILAAHLRTGTKSCGCAWVDSITKHGHAKSDRPHSPEFQSWTSMLQRCNNPNNSQYHNYGAKGIKVCQRWKEFKNFLADMGSRPKGTSLDRFPNPKGNYNPGNCRWANAYEQQGNKNNSIFVTFNGETKCLGHWYRQFQIPWSTLYHRKVVLGLTPETGLFDSGKRRRCRP